jgi:hypothetical protein
MQTGKKEMQDSKKVRNIACHHLKQSAKKRKRRVRNRIEGYAKSSETENWCWTMSKFLSVIHLKGGIIPV